ncbi:spermidine/putrescine ABC transporter substrate-binding protein [Nocardioides sp. BP30]|uniref:polyamine ABC transporter substrate-binding protein n=1 Tax=Nocardioides sp. BP30 TaxID=3036374 RepID=UPI0024698778|nr:spermidine/putrescine ABC transporter substrate-binding protein [Nocardioides sp. BP30]WGL53734.1 spermidine/putrescine ABC transporter substrate-binding protein [Nocardioides sp. BP30]
MNGDQGRDLARLRGLTQPRMSRRGLLRGTGALAGAGALAGFLSACGIAGTNAGAATAAATDWTAWWASKKKNGHFSFDNWAAYIDADKHGRYPTLEKFTKDTGIKVNYNDAAVADTASYYGKISPALAAGKPTSSDLFVMTNGWEFTELVQKGWVAQLDHSRMPNFLKNAVPTAASPTYDFDALHSAVWQSGYTGIAYHSDLVDGDITSWADLTKPEYKNKIGLLSDLDELSVPAMCVTGSTPETSGEAEWRKAATWLTDKLRPNVRKFYDQGYLDAFKAKQIPIVMAYSGDILALQSDYPHARFAFPSEGFTAWHDNMMIPITARNPLDALTWMDYYYQPSVAAVVEDYIWYVSPVQGVRDYIAKQLDDPDYSSSTLAFPADSVMAKAHNYPVMKNRAEHDLYTSIFQPVVQGS